MDLVGVIAIPAGRDFGELEEGWEEGLQEGVEFRLGLMGGSGGWGDGAEEEFLLEGGGGEYGGVEVVGNALCVEEIAEREAEKDGFEEFRD